MNLIISATAQSSFNLRGIVIDSVTSQPLVNAAVKISPGFEGIITNDEGVFDVDLNKGKYIFVISYLGYKAHKMNLDLNNKATVIIKLQPISVEVGDINISGKRDDDNIRKNAIGTVEINAKEIEALPALMGEPDVINSIRLTPGIQGVGEGNSGIYVRGGDAGQNLILLDNMPLYNPAHLLGFLPVFNSDIINNVKVVKGGMPAYYGGKASSVIDIEMREGSTERFKGSGSVGLLSADLTLQTPLNKGKGSIIVSGRKTYFELLKTITNSLTNSSNQFLTNTDYSFYDGSAKLFYKLTPKTRLYISTFIGNDTYGMIDDEFDVSNEMEWGNFAGALHLNHVFNDVFSGSLTSGFTKYHFGMEAMLDQYNIDIFSEVEDWYQNFDFNYISESGSKFRFGGQFTYHIITPNKIDVNVEDVKYKNINKYYSNELAAYINFEKQLTKKINIDAGLRYTYYQHIGPYTHYTRDEIGQLADSIVFSKNEKVKDYHGFDPHFTWRYLVNDFSSIKGSFSLANQFIHLASVGSVSLPTDVWLSSTSFIKPQKVAMGSVGYFRNFIDNMFETSVELYYKKMYDQIDFRNGVLDNVDNTKIENNIVTGEGQSYGVEFFVKKQLGNTTGWISYTFSKTNRVFEEFNNGETFPAKYDRVHDLSVTLSHKINKKWNVSAVFIYATGNAMTLPAGRYMIQGNVANHYTGVNSFRMPSYHRLDLSANYILKKKRWLESTLNFSIFNVYNRANPYFIYFRIEGNLDEYYLSVEPQQISMFPILPSITWIVKF